MIQVYGLRRPNLDDRNFKNFLLGANHGEPYGLFYLHNTITGFLVKCAMTLGEKNIRGVCHTDPYSAVWISDSLDNCVDVFQNI